MNRKHIQHNYAKTALAVTIILAMLAILISSRFVWADGNSGVGDNDFSIKVEAGTGPNPSSKPTGSGDSNDPVKVHLADPFSTQQQQWNIIVTSNKNQVGKIYIKFVDSDPNRKIKGRSTPTSVNGTGSLSDVKYYPDLFTQMRFSVSNGTNQLWSDKLGTDGALDLPNKDANNPAKPGYLEAKLPVNMNKGDTRTFVVREYIDTSIAKDDLYVYNGTSTGLTLLVKGETR
jgi:hypothetical protein